MNTKCKKMIGEEEDSDPFSTAILVAAIIVMLVVFSLICFFQLCSVNGKSMTDSIQDGDNVLITHYKTNFETGDVIVLDVKKGTTEIRLIKRVIAVENEIFKFEKEGNYVYLYKKNGDGFVKTDEPYIKETMLANNFTTRQFVFGKEYTVPKNSYLYLGDNRNDSSDSRVYGFAEKDDILGKMVVKLKKGSLEESLIKLIFHANDVQDETNNKVNLILSTF